jgi:subfamily B ATP-binding cassette protein MsbA
MKIIYKHLSIYSAAVLASIVSSFLAVIFTIFSYTFIVPFLQLLFNKIDKVHEKVPLIFSLESLKANLYYYLSVIIETQGQSKALFLLTTGAIVLYIFKNLFVYTSSYILAPVRTGILRRVRNELYNRIIILPLGFYKNNKKGDIISRVINDVQELDESILKPFQTILIQALTIIFFLTTLFIINVKLTLIVLCILPIGAVIISRISKKLKKSGAKVQLKQGVILSYIEEAISGLRIIKAFNAIDFTHERFKNQNDIFTDIKNIIYRRTDLASPLSEFLGTILVVIILIYGGSIILNDKHFMNAETFIMYLMLFVSVINPAKSLTSAFYFIQKGKASINRIQYILNAEEVIEESPDAKPLKTFSNKIEFKEVGFAYEKENFVLKNINLEINKGKTIAIVGASGAGKSTFVDLIPRFYDCTAGEILVDNIPIKKIKIDDLRNLIGIVAQDTILFNDTIYNNIAFGKTDVSINEIEEVSKIANAYDFIMQTPKGFQSIIGDSGNMLSGGQKQRISIARAILKNPPILILDEATSALDSESEYLVQQALEKIMANRTTIIVAHKLSTIKNASTIVVLENGQIAEMGTHNELIKLNGIYYKLSQMQSLK